jgi:hypothetical protein
MPAVRQSISDRHRYISVVRHMTPARRLAKAAELSELGKCLFPHGLRRQLSEADDRQLRTLYLSRLTRCHDSGASRHQSRRK